LLDRGECSNVHAVINADDRKGSIKIIRAKCRKKRHLGFNAVVDNTYANIRVRKPVEVLRDEINATNLPTRK
jgi:hypothetical protein